jgi:opacity protein-like surface antigen
MTPLLRGQAIPTASRIGAIQVGVGGSLTNPDYAQKNIGQITFFADYNLAHNLGVEGVIHYSVNTPTDISENSYMAGVRYIVRRKRFEPYGKVLFGVGHFGLQSGNFVNPNTATYFEYAVGGGLDIHATRHINVRAIDFEAQKWPGFATHGLSPLTGTIGVAYVFH